MDQSNITIYYNWYISQDKYHMNNKIKRKKKIIKTHLIITCNHNTQRIIYFHVIIHNNIRHNDDDDFKIKKSFSTRAFILCMYNNKNKIVYWPQTSTSLRVKNYLY